MIGANQNFTLNAVATSEQCGIKTVSRVLRSGKPGTVTSISGPSLVATGGIVTYFAGTSENATEYEWWLPYPYDTVTTFNYFGSNWAKIIDTNGSQAQFFTGYAKRSGLVQVMGKNVCGCGGAQSISVSHSAGGSGPIPRMSNSSNTSIYKVYPSPTNSIINIELKDIEQKPTNNSTIFAELYNMMGEVKRNVLVNNNIATIEALGLPRGIYILKININGTIESHQVAIE